MEDVSTAESADPLSCSSRCRGVREYREEPTEYAEQQPNQVDLDQLAAGELLVEDTKLWTMCEHGDQLQSWGLVRRVEGRFEEGGNSRLL